MKDTKLIRFLATLDVNEMKSFQKFARSPYHNSNKQLIGLLDCLAKYHPSFDQRNFKKETIYRKIHPKDKGYHEGRMSLLMAQLVQLFKQFLAYEQVRKNEFLQRKYRLHGLLEKRIDDEYQKEVKKQEEALNDWREDEHYHLERLLLNWELFHHPATARHQVGMPSLDNAMESLDRFFVWSKLKLSAAVFNRERIFSEKHGINLLENILEKFGSYIRNVDELNIYRKIIQAQADDKKDILSGLVADYIKHAQHLSAFEKAKLYIFINNLFSRKSRQGGTINRKDLFKLINYKFTDPTDKVENILTETGFTNIAVTGSALHEFKWTENFIKQYQEKLNETVREDAVSLANAYLHFYTAMKKNDKKSYKETINYLNKINTNRPFYFYRIKIIALKIHFEYYLRNEEEYAFLMDYCNAFEKQLKREKTMGQSKKSAFINFVEALKKLIDSVSDPNFKHFKRAELIEAISSKNDISSKIWLLEKSRELKTTP